METWGFFLARDGWGGLVTGLSLCSVDSGQVRGSGALPGRDDGREQV